VLAWENFTTAYKQLDRRTDGARALRDAAANDPENAESLNAIADGLAE
jgi:hypothetical protein